jgi:transposase
VVDRDSLALLLAQGLSLAEIGRRFGRDESTIGYWVKKHGLKAVHAEKHAGRGGLSRERLMEFVEAGLSIRKIAARTQLSPTVVRYWLDRHGLATYASKRRADGRRARAEGELETKMECPRHGLTRFRLEGRGAYRCLLCRQERVAERRRTVKEILVAEAGGACVLCGYDRYLGALQFHHIDPGTKAFALSQAGASRSLDKMRAEAEKCALVCANCHAELEAGLQTVVDAVDKVVPAAPDLSG